MNESIVSDLAGKRVLLLADAAFERMFIRELLDQVDIQVIEPPAAGTPDADYDGILADFTHLPDIDLSLLYRHRKPVIAVGNAPDGLRTVAVIGKPIEPQAFYRTLAEALAGRKKPPPRVAVDGKAARGPMVDFREGERRLGGNRQAYFRVLRLFLENQTDAPGEIRLAIGNNDLETAVRAAHSVKGVAGNVGAKSVQEAALPLEQALKREDLDEARVLLRELEKRLERAKAAIREYLSQQDAATERREGETPRPQKPDETPQWPKVLMLLEGLLRAADLRRPVACEEVMEQLTPLPWPDGLAAQFQQVAADIGRYRYPAAEGSIRRLRDMISEMEQ